MQRIYATLAIIFIEIAMVFESISFWFNERVKLPPQHMSLTSNKIDELIKHVSLTTKVMLEKDIEARQINNKHLH